MIKIKKLKILFKGFLFVGFGFWFLIFSFNEAAAQIFPDFDAPQSNYFDIFTSNKNPFPYEEIAAKIQNANFDISHSDISWSLNDKTILRGKAEDKATFEVGGLGTSAVLTVSVLTPNGQRTQESIILRPTDIDMLWQADTYTPYFYKGKSFAAPLSKVTVAAIPRFIYQGDKIPPQNLLFKWYLNNAFKEQGWGKDSFNFKMGLFIGEDYKIETEISSASDILFQKRSLIIAARNPRIIFYEYNPFENARAQKAISSFEAAGGAFIQFIAEPYFAPNDKLGELIYKWEMNGEKLAQSKPLNTLNFSSEQGSSGNALVNLTISYKNLLEKISGSFRISVQ